MATKTKPEPDSELVDEQPVEQLPAGSVVRHADDEHRHALLIGYNEDGHPLIVDLPTPRAHHLGVVRA